MVSASWLKAVDCLLLKLPKNGFWITGSVVRVIVMHEVGRL
jgi:hypothetical protein